MACPEQGQAAPFRGQASGWKGPLYIPVQTGTGSTKTEAGKSCRYVVVENGWNDFDPVHIFDFSLTGAELRTL